MQIQSLVSAVLLEERQLSEDDIVTLFSARGADFDLVCEAAGVPPSLSLFKGITLSGLFSACALNQQKDINSVLRMVLCLHVHLRVSSDGESIWLADQLRERLCGNVVRYAVNR